MKIQNTGDQFTPSEMAQLYALEGDAKDIVYDLQQNASKIFVTFHGEEDMRNVIAFANGIEKRMSLEPARFAKVCCMLLYRLNDIGDGWALCVARAVEVLAERQRV